MKIANVTYKLAKNILNASRKIPAVILANIIVTRKCTQNCLQCSIPQNSEGKKFMSYEDFVFILDRLNKHGTQFISFSGGEPLLHPQLDEFIHYAGKKKFLHLQLLTNLYASKLVVEKIIDTLFETNTGIQISFDGFGEVADKLRGAKNVSKVVMQGIKILDSENKKRKKPIRTSLNIVVSRMNLHQVPEILDYVESLGWKANVDLYRWSSSNHREMEELKIKDPGKLCNILERVKQSPSVTTPSLIIDGYMDFIREEYYKRCPYLECPSFGSKLYIEPDGNINVCIGGPVGNLIKQELIEIFNFVKWEERKKEMERCKGCWNSCYTPSAVIFHPKKLNDLKMIWEIVKSK